jgi:hypothetical protein
MAIGRFYVAIGSSWYLSMQLDRPHVAIGRFYGAIGRIHEAKMVPYKYCNIPCSWKGSLAIGRFQVQEALVSG